MSVIEYWPNVNAALKVHYKEFIDSIFTASVTDIVNVIYLFSTTFRNS